MWNSRIERESWQLELIFPSVTETLYSMDCEQESGLSYRFRWKVCETLAISQRMGWTRFLTRSKMYLLTCSELRVTISKRPMYQRRYNFKAKLKYLYISCMLFLFFVYRIISIERNDRGLFLRWLNDPNFARIANWDLNLASRTLRYERAPLVKKSEIWRPRFFFALLSTWPKNKTHYRQPWRRSSSGRCNGTKPGVKRRWAKEQRRRNERG